MRVAWWVQERCAGRLQCDFSTPGCRLPSGTARRAAHALAQQGIPVMASVAEAARDADLLFSVPYRAVLQCGRSLSRRACAKPAEAIAAGSLNILVSGDAASAARADPALAAAGRIWRTRDDPVQAQAAKLGDEVAWDITYRRSGCCVI